MIMNERMDKFLGDIWNLVDDLDCLIQMLDELERLYEFDGDQKNRRTVKTIGLVIGQLHDRLRDVVKKVVYGSEDEIITE